MNNQFQIRVHSGSLRGQAFVINKQEFKVGRDPSCDIVLNENAVSRIHLLIYPQAYEAIVLVDNNSTNGTTVNNVQVTAPVQITENDVIMLGGEVALVLEKVPVMQSPYPPYPQQPGYPQGFDMPAQQYPPYQAPFSAPSAVSQPQQPYAQSGYPVQAPQAPVPPAHDGMVEPVADSLRGAASHLPSSAPDGLGHEYEMPADNGFGTYQQQPPAVSPAAPMGDAPAYGGYPQQPYYQQPQMPYPGQEAQPYGTAQANMGYDPRSQYPAQPDPYMAQAQGGYNPMSQYPPQQPYPPYGAPYGADQSQYPAQPGYGYPPQQQQYPGYYGQQLYGNYGAQEYESAEGSDESRKRKKLFIILGIILLLILAIVIFIIYIDSNYLWCDVFPFLWSPEACAIYP